jgi:hypothetical protein
VGKHAADGVPSCWDIEFPIILGSIDSHVLVHSTAMLCRALCVLRDALCAGRSGAIWLACGGADSAARSVADRAQEMEPHGGSGVRISQAARALVAAVRDEARRGAWTSGGDALTDVGCMICADAAALLGAAAAAQRAALCRGKREQDTGARWLLAGCVYNDCAFVAQVSRNVWC